MQPSSRSEQQRLAYNQREAAAQLGISVNHFKDFVRPTLPCVYVGGARRWRHSDLLAWLDRNTAPAPTETLTPRQ